MKVTPRLRGQAKTTFRQNPQRVQGDPDAVSDPRERPPFGADAGQHVEGVPAEDKWHRRDGRLTGTRVSSPEDLNGAPEVEDEEDHRPVLHLLQTTEDHEENDVPAGHLQCGGEEVET